MALKLAAALLRRPVLLFLSPLYDMLPAETLAAAFARLKEMGTTVIALTHRPQSLALDGYLWIGRHKQERVESAEILARRLRGEEADALSR